MSNALKMEMDFPPLINWVNLNTNGSSLGNFSIAGGEGLLRNEDGDWINSFSTSLRKTSFAMIEL